MGVMSFFFYYSEISSLGGSTRHQKSVLNKPVSSRGIISQNRGRITRVNKLIIAIDVSVTFLVYPLLHGKWATCTAEAFRKQLVSSAGFTLLFLLFAKHNTGLKCSPRHLLTPSS